MTLHIIGRLAGVLALTVGLAGCIDVSMDIKVKSPTEAKATMTQTIGAQFYPMIKASAKDKDAGGDSFCAGEDKGTLTENADGSATCVMTSSGAFDELKYDEDDSSSKPTFTANPDGTVRVAVETKGMIGDLGAEQDEQTKAMMQQMFEGHFLPLRFGGAEVVETNMDDVGDGYAEKKMAFLDLINGTMELPEELYAVVRP
jgi:hypothetical protein